MLEMITNSLLGVFNAQLEQDKSALEGEVKKLQAQLQKKDEVKSVPAPAAAPAAAETQQKVL